MCRLRAGVRQLRRQVMDERAWATGHAHRHRRDRGRNACLIVDAARYLAIVTLREIRKKSSHCWGSLVAGARDLSTRRALAGTHFICDESVVILTIESTKFTKSKKR